MISTVIFAILFLLVVVLPISSVLTIFLFWKSPFVGTMFASLQVFVGAAVRVILPDYSWSANVDGSFAGLNFDNSQIQLSISEDFWTGFIVMGVSVVFWYLASKRVPTRLFGRDPYS